MLILVKEVPLLLLRPEAMMTGSVEDVLVVACEQTKKTMTTWVSSVGQSSPDERLLSLQKQTMKTIWACLVARFDLDGPAGLGSAVAEQGGGRHRQATISWRACNISRIRANGQPAQQLGYFNYVRE